MHPGIWIKSWLIFYCLYTWIKGHSIHLGKSRAVQELSSDSLVPCTKLRSSESQNVCDKIWKSSLFWGDSLLLFVWARSRTKILIRKTICVDALLTNIVPDWVILTTAQGLFPSWHQMIPATLRVKPWSYLVECRLGCEKKFSVICKKGWNLFLLAVSVPVVPINAWQRGKKPRGDGFVVCLCVCACVSLFFIYFWGFLWSSTLSEIFNQLSCTAIVCKSLASHPV